MESNGKPVVVGIDDKQPTALRFALREAHRREVEMRVVHSAGVPIELAAEHATAAFIDDLREEGQKVLDHARHFIEQEVTPVRPAYVLTTAPPVAALEAEARDASIVVVGSDNTRWPDRLIGGDVASHVALHAPCPVVVVPERVHPTPLSGGVVIALDGDTPANGPLQFAFEQARANGRVLHVLHAIEPGTKLADAEAIRTNIGEVLAGWSDVYPDVRVLQNFPIDGVEEACRRATEYSELVVVGRPHNRTLPFAFARPLAAEVLKHAHCPVAVVSTETRVD